MSLKSLWLAATLLLGQHLASVEAFQTNSPLAKSCSLLETTSSLQTSRRSFVEYSASLALIATVLPEQALASGGATAGGAYLLSAKQRYNDRVKAGVKAFLGIGGALESGNIDAVRSFFTQEDEGSWKDLSAAGYLLANAFRRNSTAAPDSLPSVKVCIFEPAMSLVPVCVFLCRIHLTFVVLWQSPVLVTR